jgi:beta-glucanase (GH16 family)
LRRSTSRSLGVAAFVVALAVGTAGAAPTVVSTTQTEITIGGLACGTQYRVRVSVAGNSRGTTLNAVTQPCAPPPPPPPPAAEPPPIAGQGYAVTFQDQFEIFNGGSWGEGIWYDPGSPPNSIYVEDGVLHLVSRRSQGYQDITVTTEGGSDPRTFQYGYLEARMRWTAGNGAWPGFWLLSYRHATNPDYPSINSYCTEHGLPPAECYSGEIDIFEGQGSQPSTHYHTIHENSCGCYGVSDEQNAANWTSGLSLSGFHTYAVLWTANVLRWYLDDNLIHTERASDSARNGRIFAALRQPMFLLFSMWSGGWTVGPDPSTPDELHTEVDSVTVWQQ